MSRNQAENAFILTVDHAQLERIIDINAYDVPTIVNGRTGIGKSEMFMEWGMRKAEELGLDFVLWHQLTFEEKAKYARDDDGIRTKSFIFFDQRLMLKDRTDLEGLIDLAADEEYVVIKPHAWLRALQHGHGCLVLEEFNLADRSIQRASYQLLWDRAIGEFKLGDNIAIFATGNLPEDRAGVKDLLLPVRKRVAVYILRPADKDTMMHYASRKKWHPAVISYLMNNPQHILYDAPDNAFTIVPRSWSQVSKQMYKCELFNYIPDEFILSGVLESLAKEFVEYIRIGQDAQSPEELENNGFKFSQSFIIRQYELLNISRYLGSINLENEAKSRQARLEFANKAFHALGKEKKQETVMFAKFLKWQHSAEFIGELISMDKHVYEEVLYSIAEGKKYVKSNT